MKSTGQCPTNDAFKWLAAVSRRVKLVAIGERADVVDGNAVTLLGEGLSVTVRCMRSIIIHLYEINVIPGSQSLDVYAHFRCFRESKWKKD